MTVELPRSLRDDLEQHLGYVEVYGPVGGGSISRALRIRAGEADYCLKYREEGSAEIFRIEAEGLSALRRRADGALGVPRVAAWGGGDGSPAWIATTWVEGAGSLDSAALGRGLATLHRPDGEGWGWEEDNFIGPLVQENATRPRWGDFWREMRIEPQLRAVRDRDLLPGRMDDWNVLLADLPDRLSGGDEEGPSLLHGDLWNGNVLAGPEGTPYLIDPAVYRGHREVDLAMMRLFGGFDRRTYSAYDEAWPPAPGASARLPVYQLFYLLVHVNLFGAGYLPRTDEALSAALAA